MGTPLVEPVETTPATLDDLPALIALEETGFPARERWSAESWRGELTGDGRTVFVVRTPAGIVGAVTVRTVGPTADLYRVVVDPSVRRSGIGRQLVSVAVDAAERAGARKVVLEVRYDNEPAIALYQSLGFEQLGVRKDYYGTGIDALILKLYDLDPEHPGSAVEGTP
ncbi:MAG: GNAT family N-acetyltransferase [Propionibacteriaceae bacterium]